jgi:hypothetical protein
MKKKRGENVRLLSFFVNFSQKYPNVDWVISAAVPFRLCFFIENFSISAKSHKALPQLYILYLA